MIISLRCEKPNGFISLGALAGAVFLKWVPMSQYAISPTEQIECMTENGVRFCIAGIETAEKVLTDKNFFFKVKAFDKNFAKYGDPNQPQYGKYIDLDFAYLMDLSRKDAKLREFILDAALDLEHYLKVSVNRALMNSRANIESLVKTFFEFSRQRSIERMQQELETKEMISWATALQLLTNELQTMDIMNDDSCFLLAADIYDKSYGLVSGIDCNHVQRSLVHLGTSAYSKGLFEKYGDADHMDPWHFMEMASFGDFINFYKFVFFDSPIKDIFSQEVALDQDALIAKQIKNMLFPAKTLRNAAAHNDCLLNTLSKNDNKPRPQVRKYLMSHLSLDEGVYAPSLKVNVVYDFTALLICFD